VTEFWCSVCIGHFGGGRR